MIATAPAVLNAISRATGRRIFRLPATPERVFRALHGRALHGIGSTGDAAG